MSKLSELNRKRQTLMFRIRGVNANLSNIVSQYQGEKDTPFIITKREAYLVKEATAILDAIDVHSSKSWDELKQHIK